MEDLTEIIIYSKSGNTVKIDWVVYGGHKYEQHMEDSLETECNYTKFICHNCIWKSHRQLPQNLFWSKSVYAPTIK